MYNSIVKILFFKSVQNQANIYFIQALLPLSPPQFEKYFESKQDNINTN